MTVIEIVRVPLAEFVYIVENILHVPYTGQKFADPGWGTVYVPR